MAGRPIRDGRGTTLTDLRHNRHVCVEMRRRYRADALDPARVADFVSAALLSVLSPSDWQVTADVELVAAQYAQALAHRVKGGSAVVEVAVHSTHVELVVSASDPEWVTERVRVRPRRPFAATFACDLPEPRRPVLARPVLWSALGRARVETSWADTWGALHDITQGIRLAGEDPLATLDAVADGVLTATAFTVAAVNVVVGAGLEVCAVGGSAEARATLLGVVEPAEEWAKLIDNAVVWGTLLFAPHDADLPSNDAMTSWTPSGDVPADPELWHPDDALFAPLYSSTDTLLGVLSVDLPPGAPRPGVTDLERLEVFAEHAASAVERAQDLHRAALGAPQHQRPSSRSTSAT